LLKKKLLEEKLEKEKRDQVTSRETMFRFYSKDTEKMRRLTTPGYFGIDAF
jgi:hypothetical protein